MRKQKNTTFDHCVNMFVEYGYPMYKRTPFYICEQ